MKCVCTSPFVERPQMKKVPASTQNVELPDASRNAEKGERQFIDSAGATRPGTNASPSGARPIDRKSTRLNSSHHSISYAVLCLKKKKPKIHHANSPMGTELKESKQQAKAQT